MIIPRQADHADQERQTCIRELLAHLVAGADTGLLLPFSRVRPRPWTVRFANRRAGQGWQDLLAQVPENLDRAWVAITSEPHRSDHRQHPLRGALGSVKVGGAVPDALPLM